VTRLKERVLRCLNSDIDFSDKDIDKQLRYNIINLTVIFAILGLIFGMLNNLYKHDMLGAYVDITGIVILVSTISILRYRSSLFELISTILTIEFIILFNMLVIISHPADLKHIWLLTFPALIFFYKGTNTWLRWVAFFILTLFISKLQPFYSIAYSLNEIIYISVVIIMMTIVIYFYKARIDQGNQVILYHKEQLEKLTKDLESKVQDKTKELQSLNFSLEEKVQEKANELVKKDALILAQSRQAAMGEMISMIAHQWRQPLSTITLQISNIKINAMLGKASVEETNTALEHISDTIIYLSETIDDFQSFFRPNKEKELVNACELVERGISFSSPRLNVAHIAIEHNCEAVKQIMTHTNEFTQVIINIINNSIDVLLEREVKGPTIIVNNIIDNDHIKIQISDNGGGIDEKIIHTIFEPYFSTKGKNGTGLGLYMSKMILEKELAGSITVTNSSEGAMFVLSIPFEK